MKLDKDLQLRKIGDEYIIVQPETGIVDVTKVCTLSSSAAMIWKEFYGKDFSESEVVDLMLERYIVSREQVQGDVNTILKQFKDEGMLMD